MRTVKKRDAYEIVTLTSSFHGRTLATLTATGQDKIKFGFDPLPEGFVTVPSGDIEALRGAVSERTAAVLLEIVQGEGGVKPFPREYLEAVAGLCRERDILFMNIVWLCSAGNFGQGGRCPGCKRRWAATFSEAFWLHRLGAE